MNIADQAKTLIKEFEEPFNDIDVHLRVECPEDWSEDYAICGDFYWDVVNSEYFDQDALRRDLENKIKDHFGGNGENVVLLNDHGSSQKNLDVGAIYIVMYYESQEIEIYRHKEE